MILFWTIGALLAAGALVLILRPLLFANRRPGPSRRDTNVSIYRDQLRELDADLAAGKFGPAEHARARTELEARLLEDVAAPDTPGARAGSRNAAIAVGVALPLFAVVFYLVIGNPAALTPRADEHALTAKQLETMIDRLAAKLRENPDDADGWRLLGRSYTVLGRFPEAADAYAKAAVRAPRDAQLLADLADVLAMARGQTLQGEPEKLVLRALELEPTNLKALALAGTAAYERKDFAAAAAYWERMLPLVPPNSEDARSIEANVAEARALAGKPGSAVARKSVKGTVRIAPAMKAKTKPDDAVFIFARAADGPPMPLAVLRKQVRDLPVSFSLDDSMAMSPGMSLSAHSRVVVGARVSRSGKASAQPGDLQGASAPVANDAANVNVLIDSEIR